MLIYFDQHENSSKFKRRQSVVGFRNVFFFWDTTVCWLAHLLECPFYEVVSKLLFQMGLFDVFFYIQDFFSLLVDFELMLGRFVIILHVK